MEKIKNFITAVRRLTDASKSNSISQAVSGAPKTERQVIQEYTGWVYTAVSIIAQNAATIKFQMKQRTADGYEVIEHPLIDILENPNLKQSGTDLAQVVFTQYNLMGNAYIWIVGDVLAEPTELIPLSAARMDVDTRGDFPVYNYRTITGQKRQFSYGEIVHFKKIDPFNDDKGRSPLLAIQDLIASEEKAMDFHLSMFDNQAVPSGVLTYEGRSSPQRDKMIADNWQKYQGAKNAGATLVLGDGTKWQATGGSSADAELLATRKFNMDAFLAHFQLPPSVLGVENTANRATAEANDFTFQSRVIKPQMAQLVNALSHKLLTRYRTADNLKLDFEDPVIPDKEYKLREWTAGIDRWMTTNEVREQAGLEGVGEDGDVLFRGTGQISLQDATYLPSSAEAETGEVGASIAGQAAEE